MNPSIMVVITSSCLFAATALSCGSGGDSCNAGAVKCVGNSVHTCDGSEWSFILECGLEATCFNGACTPKVIGADYGGMDTGPADAWTDVPDSGADVIEAWDIPSEADDEVVTDTAFDDSPDIHPGEDIVEPFDSLDATGDETTDDATDDQGFPSDPGASDEGTDPAPEYLDLPSDPGGGDDASASPDTTATDPGTAVPCGNGQIDPGEDCDGTNLGGKGCEQLLYASGTLRCTDDCRFDTLLCGDNSHRFAYDAVPNIWVKGGFVDVAWHPDGDYALLVGYSGAVVRYDPGAVPLDALTVIGTTTGVSPKRVAFAPGKDAYIVGYDPEGNGRVFKVPAGGQSLEEIPGAQQKARFVSIKFAPGGSFALIAGQSSNYTINYVATFDPATETTDDFKGYSATAGVTDFMWVPGFGAFDGVLGALLVHGINGKDAHMWLELNKEINPANSGTASFGNMGRCAYRPGAQYGLVAGTSSNVLYVYTGNVNLPSWSKEYLEDFGSGVYDVAFRPDGKRALVLGRPWGTPLTLHVQEHRPKTSSFSGDDFIHQDIPDWDSSPYFANSSTYLLAAAFRPGVTCDEGLLVGDDPGTISAPSYGTVVRFVDTDVLDCP